MTLEPRPPGLPARVGGAALGSLLALTFGDFTGALAGTAMTPILEGWVEKMFAELRGRGEQIAAGAAAATGLDEDEVVELILTNEDIQPLVMRVLSAAKLAHSPQKLQALGAILGEAVTSRPRLVDEDLLIVAAIEDLEPAHVRILEALERINDPDNPNQSWTMDAIEQETPDLSPIARPAALGGAIRHGLVDTLSLYGALGYEITGFGRVMLAVLRLPPKTTDSGA